MKHKIITILFSLFINLFLINSCFATLNNPTSTAVDTIGQGNAMLNWHWATSTTAVGTIKQFKILWREYTDDSSKSWEATYPSATGGPDYTYDLRGLIASTPYEWRIKAEAQDPTNDSSYSSPNVEFTTTESQWFDAGSSSSTDGRTTPISLLNPFGNIGNIGEAANKLMEFFLVVAFAVGPILIIYAGYLLITQPGNTEAIKKAKQIILWVIVALSIMLFSKGVPSVVKDIFQS